MKANIKTISMNLNRHDELRGKNVVNVELQFSERMEANGLFGAVGKEVYIYPKSRWGMLLDWLLRA